MVKQQCLFGTLLFIKVPGRHFLVPESWRKGVNKMTELNRQSGENEERIIEIEIERLRPFKEHPFQVKDVLYRVTPVFEGSNLVASGVLMEAESVEDKGEGILCCV
jgi:hypothetical protein